MLVTAVAFTLLGVLAISLATVPYWLRACAVPVWLAIGWREIEALQSGWRRCNGVRFFASGDIEVRNPQGAWERVQLADGSVLLRRFGWLRLVGQDGTRIHELVRGSRREDPDWRRLHVIWRHV